MGEVKSSNAAIQNEIINYLLAQINVLFDQLDTKPTLQLCEQAYFKILRLANEAECIIATSDYLSIKYTCDKARNLIYALLNRVMEDDEANPTLQEMFNIREMLMDAYRHSKSALQKVNYFYVVHD